MEAHGEVPNYFFLPGEFVQWNLPCGDVCIGRIHSVAHMTLSVSRWNVAADVEDYMQAYNLPPAIVDTQVVHVIQKPLLSSVIYVFNSSDLSQFKVRYVYGMQHLYRIREAYDVTVPPQSLSCIIFMSLTKISLELQRYVTGEKIKSHSLPFPLIFPVLHGSTLYNISMVLWLQRKKCALILFLVEQIYQHIE